MTSILSMAGSSLVLATYNVYVYNVYVFNLYIYTMFIYTTFMYTMFIIGKNCKQMSMEFHCTIFITLGILNYFRITLIIINLKYRMKYDKIISHSKGRGSAQAWFLWISV